MPDSDHGTAQSYRRFLVVLRQGFLLVCAWVEKECGLQQTSAPKARTTVRNGHLPPEYGFGDSPSNLSDEDVSRIGDYMLERLQAGRERLTTPL